ncbi:Mitogen-activated protein kinase kinase kinase 8 [Acipenser ruthenus]|uniref:Mitogen-activated protein kinase kinase kinase 8 n=1 Tax=Acipenser ruthenus TaxID=7906 RepID=A0A444TYN9_ACIRT|nr:Mitogen-activated protein kinase kinase kinase 8 [Acipenser ruthenus]
MEYANENARIELLLAHMNLEDFIDVMGHLYPPEDTAVIEESLVSMAQEEMDEIEETASSLLLDDSDDDKPSLLGVCMKYGTVNDLLSFANWVSNTPQTTLQHQKHEMGVVLNKSFNKNLPLFDDIIGIINVPMVASVAAAKRKTESTDSLLLKPESAAASHGQFAKPVSLSRLPKIQDMS